MKTDDLTRKSSHHAANPERADVARPMYDTQHIDGTENALEDYRRDENGLKGLEEPDETGSPALPQADRSPHR